MTATDRRIFWTALVLGLAAGAYAITRITSYGIPGLDTVTSTPAWAWAFAAGLLVKARGARLMGRLEQAAAHTFKAVGAGHLSLIRGKR